MLTSRLNSITCNCHEFGCKLASELILINPGPSLESDKAKKILESVLNLRFLPHGSQQMIVRTRLALIGGSG